jgi:hypothetical protein
VLLTRQLLEERAAQVVVVCDTDLAWLHSPLPYLQARPAADWFISTDCLSAAAEAAWEHAGAVPRCGHTPGSRWNFAYNTGLYAVRNRCGLLFHKAAGEAGALHAVGFWWMDWGAVGLLPLPVLPVLPAAPLAPPAHPAACDPLRPAGPPLWRCWRRCTRASPPASCWTRTAGCAPTSC